MQGGVKVLFNILNFWQLMHFVDLEGQINTRYKGDI